MYYLNVNKIYMFYFNSNELGWSWGERHAFIQKYNSYEIVYPTNLNK